MPTWPFYWKHHRKIEEAATFIHAHIVCVVQIVMSRHQISDLEKVGQEEPPPCHQHHEDPAIPTAVTSRGWFSSIRRKLGFDVDNLRSTPLLTPPVAIQYGSSSEPELWPDLFTIMESKDVDLAWPPGLLHSPPPVVQHSIHTLFCSPQYHSTKGQEKSIATVHLAPCWYQTAGYVQIPPTWRGHLADFAISDEISVTLDRLCRTRKMYTRTISLEYQRGHSQSRQGEPESWFFDLGIPSRVPRRASKFPFRAQAENGCPRSPRIISAN